MHIQPARAAAAFACLVFLASPAYGTTYDVGPGKPYASIGAVPWQSLQAGDIVLINWRSTPYKEKWVICRQGTAAAPIVVRGVAGPAGQLPVIDGNGATTGGVLNFWSENRGVIKIGGANVPADTTPKHIVIENLDIRSARPPYTFTADDGSTQTYSSSASAIYVEKGENITVRNCILRDSANGFFAASSDSLASRNILVEGNYIYGNGISGSIYQHNNYTAAIGMTFQYNRFGPLCAGCAGNNLKDRSAGLVVRYNWVEGGNRQLDLVDGEDSVLIRTSPAYDESYVYGNVLIEPDGAGNSQMIHYGGDSGAVGTYRHGTLFLFNNTLVSTRTDGTTLLRLSTNQETADVRNNIIYVSAAGNRLAMLDSTGVLDLSHNWMKAGWVGSFGTVTGTINDDGTSINSVAPGFSDGVAQDFRLLAGSANVDAGGPQHPAVPAAQSVVRQYLPHQQGEARPEDGLIDVGGFEFATSGPADLLITSSTLKAGKVGFSYSASLAVTGGTAPYDWRLISGSLPNGLALDASTGAITGKPTSAGTSTFTVEVGDAHAPPDSAQKVLSIKVTIAPLKITTSSLASGRVGRAYSRQIKATGGVPPYSWAIVTGSLPPGLTLNAATGFITGTAAATGTWSFTADVRDSRAPSVSATKTLSVTIAP